MATYVYVHPKTTETIERAFPMGEAPPSIELDDGTECKRSIPAEMAGSRGHTPSCWPMESNALAVHKSQCKEYAEFAAKHGVPTEFNPANGKPKFVSKKHRKAYAELVGATDLDGGYGDPFSG